MPRFSIVGRQQRESQRDQPREWIPWSLGTVSLILMLAVTVLLIVGVSVLLGLSQKNHGFVDVTNRSSNLTIVTLDIGLTWTTVPSFIFQLYGVGIASIITAFGSRQPFIELRRGSTAEKSIALDYSSYFPGQNVYRALKNRHWHLAIPFMMSMLLGVVVGPLAARMMFEQPYSRTQTKDVVQSQSFFSEYTLNDTVNWDLAPVIGLTSATTVYGGNFAQTRNSWVDGNGHAFLNFSSPELPPGNITNPSLKAQTTAYFSRLDCEVLSDDGDDVHWEIDIGGDNATYGEFYANATDRGCSWSILFGIDATFTTYLRTQSNTSCGRYGASDNSGRLIIVGAQIENLQLSRLTMLSCIPTYWTSNGSLTLDIDPSSLRSITGWAENNATVRELRPNWWKLYEDQIQQIQFVDTSVNFHADSTTAVGSLILAYSRLNSTDPLSGDSLAKASEAVWQTMYATTVSTFMLRPAEGRQIQAQLTTTTNRLAVSSVIAGILLGILTIVGVLLIVILIYTKKTVSVLFEEPVGLLGAAGLLYGNELNGMIAAAREPLDFCGRTTKYVMEELRHERVYMDSPGDPRAGRIVRGQERHSQEGSSQEMTRLRRPVIEMQNSETQISEVHDSEAQRTGSQASEISPVDTETPEALPSHTQMSRFQQHENQVNQATPGEAQVDNY